MPLIDLEALRAAPLTRDYIQQSEQAMAMAAETMPAER